LGFEISDLRFTIACPFGREAHANAGRITCTNLQ
jgi:hypothetical protein